MMKEDNHVFQGLRRDNQQIRQDAKFLWDAHNIRITNIIMYLQNYIFII